MLVMRTRSVGPGIALVALVACSSVGGDLSDRAPDGVLGGAAVSQALDINLANDEQFEAACGLFLDNPSEFAETIALASRPIGGERIQPTPADVRAWGDSACE